MVGLVAMALGGSACNRSAATTTTKTTTPSPPQAHGTAVELGREEFHLELVLDPPAGRLTGYVLDGELEKFVRIAAPSLRLVARVKDTDQPLEMHAIASAATGETVGDTSQFEATADWLKTTTRFDARLPEIIIRGKTYRDVSFNFPKGNE